MLFNIHLRLNVRVLGEALGVVGRIIDLNVEAKPFELYAIHNC